MWWPIEFISNPLPVSQLSGVWHLPSLDVWLQAFVEVDHARNCGADGDD